MDLSANDFKITSIPIPFGSPVEIPTIGLDFFNMPLLILCIFGPVNIQLYVHRHNRNNR